MSGGGNGGYDASALGAKFGNKLSTAIDAPAFAEPSSDTYTGLAHLWNSASNPALSTGAQGALDSFGKVASGADLGGQNEYFQRDLGRTLSDTQGDVLASLGGSGNLNSDLHVKTLADALGGVRDRAYEGERQYQDARQVQAAGMLPGLYSATQLPAQTQIGVGGMVDTINQNRLDAPYNRLLSALGAFNGSSGSPGMQEEVPWWQQALGFGAQLGGTALGTFARGGF